jgi:hypothetical protein
MKRAFHPIHNGKKATVYNPHKANAVIGFIQRKHEHGYQTLKLDLRLKQHKAGGHAKKTLQEDNQKIKDIYEETWKLIQKNGFILLTTGKHPRQPWKKGEPK